MDRTLILVKPDAFARGLTGEIIQRFENKGLRIAALQHMTMSEAIAKQHYAEHEGKPFFGELVEFITSGPLVAMVLEGEQAVAAARQVIGATNPVEAAPGLDPRRLRDRGRPEHGPRVGLGRVRGARGEAVLPEPLILASASPQRRAILEEAGIPFEVRPANVDEDEQGDPAAVAEANARRKALGDPRRPGAGRRHGGGARRRHLRQAARRGAGARVPGRPERPHARGGGRDRAGPGRRGRRHGGRDHEGHVPAPLRGRDRAIRGHRRMGRAGRAATRSRRRADPSWSSGSTATT